MPNANQQLENIYTTHQLGIQRLAGSYSTDFVRTIDTTTGQLSQLVFDVAENATGSATDTEILRWQRFTKKVGKLRGGAIADASGTLDGQLQDLAISEQGFVEGALQAAIPIKLSINTPSIDPSAIIHKKAYNGQTFRQMMGNLADSDVGRIVSETRAGVNIGQTSDVIVRRIVGTRRNGYTDGVVNITRNNARTVVRTLTNGVANESRQQMVEANSDIIKKERYTATLDGRTTQICASLDGKLFDVGDGPTPPLHFNCRSYRSPVTSLDIVGERPFVRDTRTRRFREMDFRKEAKAAAGDKWKSMTVKQRNSAIRSRRTKWGRENIGTASSKTNYETWLKQQPASFQDDVLGKTKGKLFRNRGLSLQQMVDKSGRNYSLKELETMHKGLFK